MNFRVIVHERELMLESKRTLRTASRSLFKEEKVPTALGTLLRKVES